MLYVVMKLYIPFLFEGSAMYPGVTSSISHANGSPMDVFVEEKNGEVGLLTDGVIEGVLVGESVNPLCIGSFCWIKLVIRFRLK